jgi:hypothetical protein
VPGPRGFSSGSADEALKSLTSGKVINLLLIGDWKVVRAELAWHCFRDRRRADAGGKVEFDLRTKTVDTEGTSRTVQLLGTADDEGPAESPPVWYLAAHCFVLVYDVSARCIFVTPQPLRANCCPCESGVSMILCGNNRSNSPPLDDFEHAVCVSRGLRRSSRSRLLQVPCGRGFFHGDEDGSIGEGGPEMDAGVAKGVSCEHDSVTDLQSSH